MESSGNDRWDTKHAARLLAEFAHAESLDQLLQRIVHWDADRPDVACVQIWLVGNGDKCLTCGLREGCSDRSRCLHLAAGHGTPLDEAGGCAPNFGDHNARLPLGTGFLGRIASLADQGDLEDVGEVPEEMVGLDWVAPQRIRGCGATAICFKGEVLGVMVGFTRQEFPEASRWWSRIFADHIGAAIANARAFEEIRRLKAQLELQNTYLREEVVEARAYGSLIGESGALRQIISQIDLVAPTEASVLILGETGTGKELVARELHLRSRRSGGPLVRVNCASIPRDLFETEFFGHVKGAYTGAMKDRAGRFETAQGGTLLLDEIGEVPLEMQAKLLQVLQEKRFERVGDDRTRTADVRIIAATNRDLRQDVAEGRFREDLYFRLHVFPIRVMPLRERKSDIPLLAAYFMELSVRELKCAKPRMTRATLAKLQNYDWPGYVRELRNVIERAVILARGGVLDFDLPKRRDNVSNRLAPITTGQTGLLGAHEILTEADLKTIERENLLAILAKSQWKIKGRGGAAQLLGIEPGTLLARIRKMGLQRPVANSGPD